MGCKALVRLQPFSRTQTATEDETFVVDEVVHGDDEFAVTSDNKADDDDDDSVADVEGLGNVLFLKFCVETASTITDAEFVVIADVVGGERDEKKEDEDVEVMEWLK
ncbi:hypothetical protein EVAR_101571_1 [Eumeta japonica]|uniref:Uncharacterized protein n=1 Tax=Eumeta variegata TaxID=151549 RepID=A0A4C1TQU8_EUMVA|nr:hypothetical protein EVAR_101571_1 [Eumeta japonica]